MLFVLVCRWVSWMWICAGPVSRGCWEWGSRRCISVTRGGCRCTQTPSSSSRSCPSASCWRIRMRLSYGGGPKKQVRPLPFNPLEPNVFTSHIPCLFLSSDWAVCQWCGMGRTGRSLSRHAPGDVRWTPGRAREPAQAQSGWSRAGHHTTGEHNNAVNL